VRVTNQEEDYLKRREDRLARLEKEAKEFYEKMARDKEMRTKLESHLTKVHQNYLDREKERTKSSGGTADNDEQSTSAAAAASTECSTSINSNETKEDADDEKKTDRSDDDKENEEP
jgi:predicted transcriptional regulator